MSKLKTVTTYIEDFLSTRLYLYQDYFRDEIEHKKTGISTIDNGNQVLDFLTAIIGNLNDYLNSSKLVPFVFPSYKDLIIFLVNFKDFLESKQSLIDNIKSGKNWEYTKNELQSIKNELISMLDVVLEIDKNESELYLPIQEMRNALITKKLDRFFEVIRGLLAHIPTSLHKKQEGYLHSNIVLILKLLGFEVSAEDQTDKGRIDAVIKIEKLTYIIEFKNSTAKKALEQIKEKTYYQKFLVDKTEIILVGVAFSNKLKNIDNFESVSYNSILETNHLMLTEANQNRLASALSNIKSGNVVEKGLIDEADLGS